MHPSSELRVSAESLNTTLIALENWCGKQDFASVSLSLSKNYSEFLREVETNLSRSIVSIRRAINATVSINRLPLDILKSILEWLSPPALDNFHPRTTGFGVFYSAPSPQLRLYDWLKVTSVCQYWRDIILSTSTMWSAVSVGPARTPNKIFDMQLKLSRNAPVDLHLWSDSNLPEMSQLKGFHWSELNLQPIVPRLRSLHLHVLGLGGGSLQLLEQLSEPAPLLEHLTLFPLNYPHSIPHLTDEDFASRYILPTLFKDQMPSLRNLTIAFFTSWPGNNFHNLRRLCICDQRASERPPQAWDLSFFVGFLNASPRLEELILGNTLALVLDGSCPARSLHLPLLKTLVLSMWGASSLCAFFTCLEVAPHSAIYLNCIESRTEVLDAICDSVCLSNLSGCLGSISRLHLRTRSDSPTDHCVLGCGASGIYIRTNPPPLQLNWPPANINGQPPHLPQFLGTYPDLPVSELQAALYSTMDVKELWVDIHFHIDVPDMQWRQLYSALPQVEKLVVTVITTWGEPPFACLEALRTGPYCPGLKELHIIFQGTGSVPPAIATVLHVLRVGRATLGCPIPKIVIGTRSLVLPSDDALMNLHDELGPDVELMSGGVPEFEWAPFTEREPYSVQYWPEELAADMYPWPPVLPPILP